MKGGPVTELRAAAYVSGGFWVACCPRPWCVSTEWYGPGPNTGRVGGLGREVFHCLRCGLHCLADWPDEADAIWRLLSQRPQAETRNWELGEHVGNLLAENITHGLIPDDQLERLNGMWLLDGHLVGGVAQLVPAAMADLLTIGGQ